MRIALIGPPQSGKSTLFAAVAEAGGSHIDLSRPDRDHLAVVKVPDVRLDWLAEKSQATKVTFAELDFIDVPGLDLSSEPARLQSQAHWPTMRNSDMLVLVVRSFKSESVPAYRGRISPEGDIEEFLTELLFADLDQVTARVAKLEAATRKPTADRQDQLKELELMKRLAEVIEKGKPISEAVHPGTDQKLLRSFAFLSQKPLLVVLNCSEDDLATEATTLCSVPCIKLSAKIEEEITQLPPEDRGGFLSDLGLDSSASERLIRACYERLNLVTFLTYKPNELRTGMASESRAWTIPAGADALTAAGQIHSDIARGFIRAETVAFDDLAAAGDMKAARAAGKVRLEGKSYVVQDGDVINFRFNV